MSLTDRMITDELECAICMEDQRRWLRTPPCTCTDAGLVCAACVALVRSRHGGLYECPFCRRVAARRPWWRRLCCLG